MGLDLITKERKEPIHIQIGYIGFAFYRKEVGRAFNKDFGVFLDKVYQPLNRWTQEDEDELLKHTKNSKGLLLLINHSDCDGLLNYNECKQIYDDIKDLVVDTEESRFRIFHTKFVDALKRCYKKRINLYFN